MKEMLVKDSPKIENASQRTCKLSMLEEKRKEKMLEMQMTYDMRLRVLHRCDLIRKLFLWYRSI